MLSIVADKTRWNFAGASFGGDDGRYENVTDMMSDDYDGSGITPYDLVDDDSTMNMTVTNVTVRHTTAGELHSYGIIWSNYTVPIIRLY